MNPGDEINTNCQGKIQMSKCTSLKKNIDESIQLALKYYKKYKDYKTKCFKNFEELRSRLRCAACDQNNNKNFDAQNKKAIIKRENVNQLIKKCYNFDLYETKVLRGVFLAYLNYAKQIKPTIDIEHTILFKMFSTNLELCADWIKFTGANLGSD